MICLLDGEAKSPKYSTLASNLKIHAKDIFLKEKSMLISKNPSILKTTPLKIFEELFPEFYPSILIKSVGDESSLVAEHLKLHDI